MIAKTLLSTACAFALTACAHPKAPPPAIAYDAAAFVPAKVAPEPARAVEIVEIPKPLPLPGQLLPPPTVRSDAASPRG